MSSRIERRDFLGFVVAGAIGPALGFNTLGLHASVRVDTTFPRQDPALVQEIVLVSHNNLARVKELVEAHPALAKAAIDWGFGDWEDAIGAASHTGRVEIAEVLLANGARPTIFSAAMLGQLDAVKGFIAAAPGCQRILGPHGLTLAHHARQGGPRAAATLAYLQQLGDADIRPTAVALDPVRRAVYTGTYVFGAGANERLEVNAEGAAGLSITRPGLPYARGLRHLGDHTFAPTGAEAVRIRFSVESDRAMSVDVLDPAAIVTGRRTS
jgi:hypothetical protein